MSHLAHLFCFRLSVYIGKTSPSSASRILSLSTSVFFPSSDINRQYLAKANDGVIHFEEWAKAQSYSITPPITLIINLLLTSLPRFTSVCRPFFHNRHPTSDIRLFSLTQLQLPVPGISKRVF
jgi:hypothetical protein